MCVLPPSSRGTACTGANTPPLAMSYPLRCRLACLASLVWTACSSCGSPRCCLLFAIAVRGVIYVNDLSWSFSSKPHRHCRSSFRSQVGLPHSRNRNRHWTILFFQRWCCHLRSPSAGCSARMLCWTELVTCSWFRRLLPFIRLSIYRNHTARVEWAVLRVDKRLVLSFLLSGESKVLHRGQLLISVCIRAANLISHL